VKKASLLYTLRKTHDMCMQALSTTNQNVDTAGAGSNKSVTRLYAHSGKSAL